MRTSSIRPEKKLPALRSLSAPNHILPANSSPATTVSSLATSAPFTYIMRRFGPSYLERFSGQMPLSHEKVISDIQQCRTEAKGGHIYQCEHCGKKVYVYHACRNRHCPACHRDQIHQWLEQRTSELLPCDYFHVTVTIPDTLRNVFRSNQKRMYSLLMGTSSESVIQLADDPKYLGGRVGILSSIRMNRILGLLAFAVRDMVPVTDPERRLLIAKIARCKNWRRFLAFSLVSYAKVFHDPQEMAMRSEAISCRCRWLCSGYLLLRELPRSRPPPDCETSQTTNCRLVL